MSTARVVWLLDFDGVVGPVTDDPDPRVWPDWASAVVVDGNDFPWDYLYSPTVTTFVSAAAAAGVEVVWLSTWNERTAVLHRALEGLVALDHLVVARPPPRFAPTSREQIRGGRITAKMQAARAHVREGDALVWSDDDLVPGLAGAQECHRWAHSRGPALVLSPDSQHGLGMDELNRVAAFAREHGLDLATPAPPAPLGR